MPVDEPMDELVDESTNLNTPPDNQPSSPTPTPAGATSAAIETSASESSDDGIRMSPAAARRLARRSLRRASPTPDLVTSLIRPSSPDDLWIGAHLAQFQRTINVVGGTGLPVPPPLEPAIPNASTERRSGPLLPPHPSSLDIPKRYGGDCIFDMYSLSYVQDPDANLLCPICHDPLVDPVTTPCDHTFCYRCLRQSIYSSPSGSACPIDRDPLIWLNCFSAARLVRTQLNNLKVKCPFHSRGCKEELRREVVEIHATGECRFRDFTCPGADCNKKLRSKPTDDTCPHVEAQCSYCQVGIEAPDRELHMLSCPLSKTRCEACWRMVRRRHIGSHQELDCEAMVISCPYQDFGCPIRSQRKLMGSHSLKCAFHPDTPSGIIIRSQRELIQSYSDLGQQIQQLNTRQDETNRRISEVTASVGRRGRGDPAGGDNRTIQDLDAGFEEVHQNLTHLEARQSMWTMNQVMPIREEVTELRNNINMIRMHVNWLLNRSREEGRIRAANNSGSSTIRREGPGDGSHHMLPERRRSTSQETDLPRL